LKLRTTVLSADRISMTSFEGHRRAFAGAPESMRDDVAE
jgi:hypothetical protein